MREKMLKIAERMKEEAACNGGDIGFTIATIADIIEEVLEKKPVIESGVQDA